MLYILYWPMAMVTTTN